MYVKIDKPLKNEGGNNKGSSYNILSYLEKENEGKQEEDKQRFFTDEKDGLYKNEVMDMLDTNNKNLGYNDFKFYSLSINPSHSEQQHILKHIGVDRSINKLLELTENERKLFERELKEYTRGVMNLYAANFNRGLTAKDLIYTAKIEHGREYKYNDKNVQHNREITSLSRKLEKAKGGERKDIKNRLKELGDFKRNFEGKVIKEGMEKSGLNSHIHIVVSRNSKAFEQENGKIAPTKLSPNAKPRYNNNHKLGDTNCKIGFNHEAWKEVSAEYFNEKYNYKAKEEEKYEAKEYKQNEKSKAIHQMTKKSLQTAKYHILQGTFSKEEKIIKALVAPKKAINSELAKFNLMNNIKSNIKDIALGKIFEK